VLQYKVYGYSNLGTILHSIKCRAESMDLNSSGRNSLSEK